MLGSRALRGRRSVVVGDFDINSLVVHRKQMRHWSLTRMLYCPARSPRRPELPADDRLNVLRQAPREFAPKDPFRFAVAKSHRSAVSYFRCAAAWVRLR
jgi:hypothetical protein